MSPTACKLVGTNKKFTIQCFQLPAIPANQILTGDLLFYTRDQVTAIKALPHILFYFEKAQTSVRQITM